MVYKLEPYDPANVLNGGAGDDHLTVFLSAKRCLDGNCCDRFD